MNKIPDISFKENLKINGFEIIDLNDLIIRDKAKLTHDPQKPHKLKFFSILTIKSGHVNHLVDFNEYEVKENQCLIISKGQVHAFNKDSIYEGNMILFTEDFMLKHLSKSTISKITRLYNYHLNVPIFKNNNELQNYIDLIDKELKNNSDFAKAEIIAALLSLYLLKLESLNINNLQSFDYDRTYEVFEKFKQSIIVNYSKSRSALNYANELFISYKHLNDICKKYTFKTAKSFIDDYVILEAKRKLSSSTISIKELAWQCGFDDSTNFSKFFKKNTGNTPHQFQKSYR